MKYKEESFVEYSQLSKFIREIAQKLEKDTMTVDMQRVEIPKDHPLEVKMKYEQEPIGGEFGLKISWGDDVEVEDLEILEEDEQ